MIPSLVSQVEKLYRDKSGQSEHVDILNPEPASLEAISSLEMEFGYELTDELKSLYLFSDGVLPVSGEDMLPLILATHHFNSLQVATDTIRDLLKFGKTARQSDYDEVLQGNLYNEYYFNHRLGAIVHQEFHPHWFPIGAIRGMSTYILVDHAPAKNGLHGQVIFVNLGRSALVLADSLQEYFKKLIKHYDYAYKQENDYKVMLRIAKNSWLRTLF